MELLYLIILTSCAFTTSQIEARANVTLGLGLSYEGSENCDETVYNVELCVGSARFRCRNFGPESFYIHAACAAHGPSENIHFIVENVNEALQLNVTVIQVGSSFPHKLRPTEAILTQSREISITSFDLSFIVRFHVTFTCLANYHGDSCDIYCSPDGHKYECSLDGEKICNKGYLKHSKLDDCVLDLCASMSEYCLNSGTCVNYQRGTSNGFPTCICPHGTMGRRCEYPTTVATTRDGTLGSNVTPNPSGHRMDTMSSLAQVGSWVTSDATQSVQREQENVRVTAPTSFEEKSDHGDPSDYLTSKPILYHQNEAVISRTDMSLWYHAIIITSVAVGVVIFSIVVCISAGFYAIRVKRKAKYLRQNRITLMNGHPSEANNESMYMHGCPSLNYAEQYNTQLNTSFCGHHLPNWNTSASQGGCFGSFEGSLNQEERLCKSPSLSLAEVWPRLSKGQGSTTFCQPPHSSENGCYFLPLQCSTLCRPRTSQYRSDCGLPTLSMDAPGHHVDSSEAPFAFLPFQLNNRLMNEHERPVTLNYRRPPQMAVGAAHHTRVFETFPSLYVPGVGTDGLNHEVVMKCDHLNVKGEAEHRESLNATLPASASPELFFRDLPEIIF